jgi:polyribonucleotide nucleotidyltransferase
MATVCGGTLSLLNAGVPLKSSVAGIAMGLVKDPGSNNFVVLSDILGEEDHLGDMDFKVTGTKQGITAFQMDIKIDSVDSSILTTALEKAKQGRMHILSIMNSTIEEPRENISEYAPKIITLKIQEDKIGAVIGPGGKNIKSITEKTEATINIDDDGSTTIFCKNRDGAEKAKNMINAILEEPEIGKVYLGNVKRVMDFGAFVEFLPGKEGLCHISKLANKKVDAVTDVVNEGDEIPVRIIEIDRMGRINLSYIDAIEPKGSQEQYKKEAENAQKRGGGRDRDNRRGNRNRKY